MVADSPGGKRAWGVTLARSYRLEHATPLLRRHQRGKRRLLAHRIGLLRSFSHRAKQPRQRAVEQGLPAVVVDATVRIDLPELLQALARHLAQRGVAGEPTRRTLMKSPAAQDGKAAFAGWYGGPPVASRVRASYRFIQHLCHAGLPTGTRSLPASKRIGRQPNRDRCSCLSRLRATARLQHRPRNARSQDLRQHVCCRARP